MKSSGKMAIKRGARTRAQAKQNHQLAPDQPEQHFMKAIYDLNNFELYKLHLQMDKMMLPFVYNKLEKAMNVKLESKDELKAIYDHHCGGGSKVL